MNITTIAVRSLALNLYAASKGASPPDQILARELPTRHQLHSWAAPIETDLIAVFPT